MPKTKPRPLSHKISAVPEDKFAGVQTGTLVRRSKHWYREHSRDAKGQLGIVTDCNVYQEGGQLITYPVIHWEGQVTASSTHPDNAELAPSAFMRAQRGRQ